MQGREFTESFKQHSVFQCVLNSLRQYLHTYLAKNKLNKLTDPTKYYFKYDIYEVDLLNEKN